MNKKGFKRLLAGIMLMLMMFGSSLTVFAYDCLENGHSFSTTRTFHHREVVSRHTHTDQATGLTYNCTSYNYYFVVKQRCSKCHVEFTLPEYDVIFYEHMTQ